MNYIFEYRDKVRDYECDIQGIVNNANYQHYLEVCRHEFILSRGISFVELHNMGTDAVVARLTMQFKVPLRGGEPFAVRMRLQKDGLRYNFLQDIYRLSDEALCLRAKVEVVCLVNGKLAESDILNEKFAPCFESVK